MPDNRIRTHPILEIPHTETFHFSWQNQNYTAFKGETIASALIANGIDVFGYHPKNHAPLGLFCANGQCAQCMVLADRKPVKACMTKIQPNMRIDQLDGLPSLLGQNSAEIPYEKSSMSSAIKVPVIIIGGGPAGLSAAAELGELGIKAILVDDKSILGGKLVLQTHRFFGSADTVYAGQRGIEIAQVLEKKISLLSSVEVWLETIAVGIFEDKTVGLWKYNQDEFILVKPEVLLVAAGARERSLAFEGNTLPGIYGAGAFQTLVNRDLVKPAERLFILGGGNVGLIAGYHAIQAGIEVVGLAEALPVCSGYKVHEDKLSRLNVPIFTSHTILEAKGNDHVQSITIAQLDEFSQPITGTEKNIFCDCVLIAVGLDSVNEFQTSAQEVNLPVYVAGDASEISEASAAIYSGKIKGIEIAKSLGFQVSEVPKEWIEFEKILKSQPGQVFSIEYDSNPHEVFPVMHCRQEIPCDPCSTICPRGLIHINPDDIRQLPQYSDDLKDCIACEQCLAICPGLAITLVNIKAIPGHAIISLAVEYQENLIIIGELVTAVDIDGNVLGKFPLVAVDKLKRFSHTLIARIQTPVDIAPRIAGIHLKPSWSQSTTEADRYLINQKPETIICRCEQVTIEEIRELVRSGITDVNQIKAATKAIMGSCGGKTCLPLIKKIFTEEGVLSKDITEPTQRPVFAELPLSALVRNQQKE